MLDWHFSSASALASTLKVQSSCLPPPTSSYSPLVGATLILLAVGARHARPMCRTEFYFDSDAVSSVQLDEPARPADLRATCLGRLNRIRRLVFGGSSSSTNGTHHLPDCCDRLSSRFSSLPSIRRCHLVERRPGIDRTRNCNDETTTDSSQLVT